MKYEDVTLDKIKGIGQTIRGPFKERLDELGITTCFDLLCRSIQELVTTTKLKDESIIKLKTKALEYLESKEYIDRQDDPMALYLATHDKAIPTGSRVLDVALHGGIKKGQFYTIWGAAGVGKTQFCHNAVVEFLNENKEKNVYWLEIESTFRSDRIVEMAFEKKYFPTIQNAVDGTLPRIKLVRAYNDFEIIRETNNMISTILKENIGLIIIDGALGQLRLDFLGLGEMKNRQDSIKLFVNRLKQIRQYFHIPFIMTNQVYTKMGIVSYDVQVGGNIADHVSTCTLQLTGKGDKVRKIKIKKDPSSPALELEVQVTKSGIEDTETNKKLEEPVSAIREAMEEENESIPEQ